MLGYGKCAEDVTKYKKDFVTTDHAQMMKSQKGGRCNSIHDIIGEDGNTACYAITEHRRQIEDSKPVHLGVGILQWSKLLFLRYDFDKNLLVDNLPRTKLTPTI